MELNKALLVLARLHTRDDQQAGFVIEMGGPGLLYPSPYSQIDYVDAWKTVREHLHMKTNPARTDLPKG